MNSSCLLRGTKGDKEGDDSVTTRQYICCILNVTPGGTSSDSADTKKIRRRYSAQTISTVKRFSIAQVLHGSLMILCQLAPSYWHISLQTEKYVHTGLRWTDALFDFSLPGVWVGLFILTTGIVGIVGAKKNARCLIVTHLVLNAFAVIFAVTGVVLACISLGSIVSCKIDGSWTSVGSSYRYGYYDYDYGRSTTIDPTVYYLLGETFKKGSGGRFYCTHPLFIAWMALESTIIVSGLIVFGLTISLLVKNSRALCGCCRACCTLQDDKEEADVSLITA